MANTEEIVRSRGLNLEELKKKIQESYLNIAGAYHKSLPFIFETGELLLEVKKRVEHGSYSWWVEENCIFSVRTAQNYMNYARNRAAIEELADEQLKRIKAKDPTLKNESLSLLTMTSVDRFLKGQTIEKPPEETQDLTPDPEAEEENLVVIVSSSDGSTAAPAEEVQEEEQPFQDEPATQEERQEPAETTTEVEARELTLEEKAQEVSADLHQLFQSASDAQRIFDLDFLIEQQKELDLETRRDLREELRSLSVRVRSMAERVKLNFPREKQEAKA